MARGSGNKYDLRKQMWGHDIHELNTDICEHVYGDCNDEECELLC